MNRYSLIAPALLFACMLSAQQLQEGMASYFDDSYQGKETRYGVRYDKRELTCAHNLHPFGSLLRVTRLDNKRSVTVRVIDEGPFVKGRIIEISRRAAETLGMIDDKEVMVRVELVKRASSDPNISDSTQMAAKQALKEPPISTPKAMEESSSPPTSTRSDKTLAASTEPAAAFSSRSAPATSQARLVREDFSQFGLYQVQLRKPAQQGWGVQVSSSSNPDYVLQEIANLQAKFFDNILLSIEKGDAGKALYKFILGPFDSEAQARSYLTSMKKRYKMNGFVVNLAKGNY